MSDLSARFAGAVPADIAEENALLRAALAQAQQRIAALEGSAEKDALTPLPNANRFRRELERVVGQAARHNSQAAILYIDLKGLGALNDRHGRFAGDAAIVHVARLLMELIRSTDVLARIGGDRFGLILDHLDHDSAIDTAERIARCIASAPLDTDGGRVTVEAAVAATSILSGDTIDEVLARADRNLALAKTQA
jgi:diguanylate cyclase (GGDEF)-like protein